MPSRRPLAIVAAAAVLVAGAVALATARGRSPEVGPKDRLLGNGRRLMPAGRLTPLGNFPTGGALTPDGRFYWTVSSGRGLNDIRIVSVRTGRVVQVVPIPGASGGIAMDPRRPLAYVSGLADSTHSDQRRMGLAGREGDVVHAYAYARRSGRARFKGLYPVPPPASASVPQSFPPTSTKKLSWPDRLAVSRDGRTLLVPLNLADSAAIVDTRSRRVRYVATGRFPYGAAILPNGRTGLVTNEVTGSVSVIDLRAGRKIKDVQVGARLSHPEGIAADPRAARAYVAIANSDQVAVIDTRRFTVARTLSVERPQGLGTAPVDVHVTPGGERLLVSESAAEDIAVFALPVRGAPRPRRGRPFGLIGRIPTAAYPAEAEATRVGPCPRRTRAKSRAARRRAAARRCQRLVYVAAKGLGVGPNPRGPVPTDPNDSDDAINRFRYLPSIVNGKAGMLELPSDTGIRRLTPAATRQVRPANAERPPAGTPLRPGGPITHVFYIVRENRTYDQVLGDAGRGAGDPKLTLFGRQVTPNMHALTARFPLLDHVFANSEASIDGHFWASAAKTSDYVHKNWFQNYAGRGRPYDFGVYAATWPGNGFLFDQAERQRISYFNYGEAVAGVVPVVDRDRTSADQAAVQTKFSKSDIGAPAGCYPNDAYIGRNAITQNPVYDTAPPLGAEPNAESRFTCFQLRFAQQLLTNSVPAFNYLVLSNDHTLGTSAGSRTPRAMVADNDDGLGRIVETISRSKIWPSSAIFVIEDDSQDGADHVDAHRIPAGVFSPYAKRGALVRTRYDFLSVIRSMELILGMKPLGLADRLATPMYDAFAAAPGNGEPYTRAAPAYPLLERNARTAAGARVSRSLNLGRTDAVPQRTLDRIIWQSVHGPRSAPPPPGPNADPGG